MNSTNRFANRLLLAVTGVVLLAVGVAAAVGALVPSIRDAWSSATGPIQDAVLGFLQQTPLAATGTLAAVSWVMPAILVLLIVAVGVLLVFIVRQGRGHTGTALREEPREDGTTVVSSSVAERAIEEAIADRPEFVAVKVATYRVRSTPVLKVAATLRRGVSPTEATEIVERTLLAFDTLLGRQLPALIHLSGGFRARVSKASRLT